MITLKEIEEALDKHHLSIKMKNGNYWRVRRNGRTKLWVTRPTHFRIPIKFGLKYCEVITHDTLPYFNDYFKIETQE